MKTKYILKTLVILFFVFTATAQQGINYKAVINDAIGDAIANTPVTVQFTLLENGTKDVYSESHNPTTDDNGIIIVNIGEGTLISGDFNTIDWGSNPHFLKTEIDTGDGLTDMGTTEFKTVPYALHAKTVESVPGSTIITYSKGDFAQGGIVFWVDETGQHGLVCAKEDQSEGIRWYAGTYGNTHATGNGHYSGKANTTLIIATQVALGDNSEPYAARICNDLLIYQDRNRDRNSYGDWYLPSAIELLRMERNANYINNTAEANGGSPLFGGYWSSTEVSSQQALSLTLFNYNYPGKSSKAYLKKVRAIRAF